MGEARPDVAVPARFGPWRREIRAFLELLALTGIAVAQPTFDILSGDGASVFVSRRSSPAAVILFALTVVLVPPVVLWALEVLVGAVVPRARRWAHGTIAAVVIGVFALEALKKATELGPRLLIACAIAAGVAGGIVVLRFATARMWLRYLAFAPVIFAVLFVFFSPVSTVVFSDSPKAAAKVTVAKPSRVVMIVMDEFSLQSLLDGNGHIDATLFPNFAKLASDSTWYRNETTVAPNTEAAVPAIASGTRPVEGTPPIAASYPHNIFTLLGGSYEMNVHEAITRLCPTSICPKATSAGPRRSLIDEATNAWTTFASPERAAASDNVAAASQDSEPRALDRGEAFVDSLQPGTTSKLDFLHVLMPHEPWHYIGTGQDYDESRGARGLIFYAWANTYVAQAARARHLLQVQASDHLLGQIITKLQAMGAYDDSLITVTADHGVAFTKDAPIRGVSESNSSEIAWTPLIIKAPRQHTGRVDDRPVRSIDVLPTMADMLGVKLPWKLDGHSVLGKPTPDGPVQLADWGYNSMKPPEGSDVISLDGPSGFAETMRASASRAAGDPALRLYRFGDLGDLVGQRAGPLLDRSGDDTRTVHLDNRDEYDHVDLHATNISWAYLSGTADDVPPDLPLVITANGKIVAVSQTYKGLGDHDTTFWAVIPPKLMRQGRNTIGVAAVEGTTQAPRLVPLEVDR